MKKKLFLIIGIFMCGHQLDAQKLYTKNGAIFFFSKAPIENIKAVNNQVTSVINTQTGEIQFSVLIKGFHFQKQLMEEHFNENYMESDQYPKAFFKGSIDNFQKASLTRDGNFTLSVSGELTMHGITKKINVPAVFTITGGVLTTSAEFVVHLADYKIRIPSIVKDNIAEKIDITVNCLLDKKI